MKQVLMQIVERKTSSKPFHAANNMIHDLIFSLLYTVCSISKHSLLLKTVLRNVLDAKDFLFSYLVPEVDLG